MPELLEGLRLILCRIILIAHGFFHTKIREQMVYHHAEINKDRTPLQRLETPLPDVCELQPKIFRDTRGFFIETYHQNRYRDLGIHDTFVQDNHSRSTAGTLRGLHYQLLHPQAKLCRVIEGEVLDVAVDIRWGSPTFGKWASVVLSAEMQNQIYVPAGFAHGFVARTSSVQFLYKCSDFYDPNDEHGIIWNDPGLAIDWDISDPLISDKDSKYPTLNAAKRELLPQYSNQ
jgi:dTDP-4-dehydrorhamnose 3,5-epimerase